MSIAFLTIGLMLLIVAPITWFSDQWRVPVVNWWRRIHHQLPLIAMPVLNQPDEDLERFRACLPHIELYCSPDELVHIGIGMAEGLDRDDPRQLDIHSTAFRHLLALPE